MTLRIIPNRIDVNMIEARAKLPADVWKAISVSEHGGEHLSTVHLEDASGRPGTIVMGPRKYVPLMSRVRGLEYQLHDMKSGGAA